MSTTPRAIPKRMRVLRFYRDANGEIRWTYKARNGKTRSDSAEAYGRLRSAEDGALDVLGGKSLRRTGGKDGMHGTMAGRPDVRVEWDL